MKKFSLLALLFGFILFLAACGGDDTTDGGSSDNGGEEAAETDGGLIGVAMPTKSSQRWVDDGNNMVEQLEALGYETDLQYAEDDVDKQIEQIENMIVKGADVLVIASIDGTALTDVLQQANEQGIEVVSYDRLIMESEHVSYYATFDNFQVGVLQASYIEEALDLPNAEGPFNIELFGGSPDDNNAYFFWDGAMSVLQDYMDEGKLVIQSDQTDFEQAATMRWDGNTAKSRMENILSSSYSGGETVDAVLSPPYDGISRGIIQALKGVGYGSGDLPLPVITGQDAELASIKSIIAGEQTQTVFKDTRDLAAVAVDMTEAILKGEEAEVNDTETYDNNVKVVPTYLVEPVSVDINNYQEVVMDSGYYSEDELE
ncbi:L-arabinose-binding periplasmic protein precursor AraF [Gracilibacillus boraciitolerans JCM 21714]|uniref:L-arabinose-binding periplasmic protein AraF n=1 Tax=Gracilibacillus boraciitolerans JCM 21714 TaxID=1298598 RepID=W4VKD3_9BACI|nr:multiple monosaccharide ABC transporter substrate-binding protein [Gracilibacillus boraciitolerans]GAE93229.1 L-arabinose-binding periplasmic protein precursor AraF [Gracilibacillus boraciitolerans JCM 21714]